MIGHLVNLDLIPIRNLPVVDANHLLLALIIVCQATPVVSQQQQQQQPLPLHLCYVKYQTN